MRNMRASGKRSVAHGPFGKVVRALKVRNSWLRSAARTSLLQSLGVCRAFNSEATLLRRLPLAFVFRARGAVTRRTYRLVLGYDYQEI